MLPFVLRRIGVDPPALFVATPVDVTGLVIYFDRRDDCGARCRKPTAYRNESGVVVERDRPFT
jgi:hypothetical protein